MSFNGGTSQASEQMNAFSSMQEAPGTRRMVSQVSQRTQEALQGSKKIHKKLVVASASGFFMSVSMALDETIAQFNNITLDGISESLERFKMHLRVHKKAFEMNFLPNKYTYTDDFTTMLAGIEALVQKLPSDKHMFGAVDKMKVKLLGMIEVARRSVNP